MSWGADEWSAAADWLVAVTAIVATAVAVCGLTSWRKQEIYREDRDLGRRLLLALETCREAFSAARGVFRRITFDPREMDEETAVRSNQIELDARISESITAIRVIFFEASILWQGADEVNPSERLVSLYRELDERRNVHASLLEARSLSSTQTPTADELMASWQAYARVGGNDIFGAEVNAVIDPVRVWVMPKLGRRK